jgi:hypothetical protein
MSYMPLETARGIARHRFLFERPVVFGVDGASGLPYSVFTVDWDVSIIDYTNR